MHRSRLLLALLGVLALPAHANWYLDNESSRLSFVSTKNADISEVHRFLTLHGKVDRQGVAILDVELESVSTGIPLRDERLRRELFEIKQYPEAQVSAQINIQPINDLAPGAQLELRLPLVVRLHGQEHRYNAELLATPRRPAFPGGDPGAAGGARRGFRPVAGSGRVAQARRPVGDQSVGAGGCGADFHGALNHGRRGLSLA